MVFRSLHKIPLVRSDIWHELCKETQAAANNMQMALNLACMSSHYLYCQVEVFWWLRCLFKVCLVAHPIIDAMHTPPKHGLLLRHESCNILICCWLSPDRWQAENQDRGDEEIIHLHSLSSCGCQGENRYIWKELLDDAQLLIVWSKVITPCESFSSAKNIGNASGPCADIDAWLQEIVASLSEYQMYTTALLHEEDKTDMTIETQMGTILLISKARHIH